MNQQYSNQVFDSQTSVCATCKKCTGFDNYYFNPSVCTIRGGESE